MAIDAAWAQARNDAASAPAQVAPKSSVSAKLHDFKGVPLEISIDDFRKLPHPDGGPARVICTGEKQQITRAYSSEPTDVMVFDEVEGSLGVKKCVWLDTSGTFGSIGNKFLDFAGSGYGAYHYTFSFVPDPKDKVLRLYSFQGTSNILAMSAVISALTEKYGPPKIEKGSVQNKMGNSFDQTTAIWSSSVSTIMVQDRFTEVDDMVILVTSNRLAAIVREAKNAKKAAQPNRI